MRTIKKDFSKFFDDNCGSHDEIIFFKEKEMIYRLAMHNLYCSLDRYNSKTKELKQIIFMQNSDDLVDFYEFAETPKKLRSEYGPIFADLGDDPLKACYFLRQWENE